MPLYLTYSNLVTRHTGTLALNGSRSYPIYAPFYFAILHKQQLLDKRERAATDFARALEVKP